jgi:hypothetical protein
MGYPKVTVKGVQSNPPLISPIPPPDPERGAGALTVSGFGSPGNVPIYQIGGGARWGDASSGTAGFFYNIRDYGATGNGVTDDTAAIDSCLAAAATNPGVILAPAGTYLTQGGHEIPGGCELWGVERTSTIFLQRAETYCFALSDPTSGQNSPSLRHVTIFGSTESLPAVEYGIGVQIGDGICATLDNVFIYGFTGTGAIGLQLINATSGTTEHTDAQAVQVINCTTCVEFLGLGDAPGTQSFGYTNFRNLYLQIGSGQTAIAVGGSSGPATALLYNSYIQGSVAFGATCTGLAVTAYGEVGQGTELDLVGEILAGSGQTRILNNNLFYAYGRFFVSYGQPADNISGAVGHEFIEEDETVAQLSNAARSIASSGSSMVIPGGSAYWNVSGTTNITQIANTWTGRVVTLLFEGILTVHAGNNLVLDGNFTTASGSALTLLSTGFAYYELGRSTNAT